MGMGRMDPGDWKAYGSAHIDGKSTAEIFRATAMKDAFDPKLIGVRESRDSALNPQSTPTWLCGDVTGSMAMIVDKFIRKTIPAVATNIYDKKPVSDPHIGVMAIGDAECDRAPLQVTQMEASIVLADQTKDLWLERGGGGNSGESYSLPLIFAGTRTVHDSWLKRRRKGFIFTIGDEPVLPSTSAENLQRVFGGQFTKPISKRQAVDLASKTYEVFHVVLTSEGYAAHRPKEVIDTFEDVLPQRVIKLEDIDKLAETIVSVMQLVNGERKEAVAEAWGGSSAVTVYNAIRDIQVGRASGGVARLA